MAAGLALAVGTQLPWLRSNATLVGTTYNAFELGNARGVQVGAAMGSAGFVFAGLGGLAIVLGMWALVWEPSQRRMGYVYQAFACVLFLAGPYSFWLDREMNNDPFSVVAHGLFMFHIGYGLLVSEAAGLATLVGAVVVLIDLGDETTELKEGTTR